MSNGFQDEQDMSNPDDGNISIDERNNEIEPAEASDGDQSDQQRDEQQSREEYNEDDTSALPVSSEERNSNEFSENNILEKRWSEMDGEKKKNNLQQIQQRQQRQQKKFNEGEYSSGEEQDEDEAKEGKGYIGEAGSINASCDSYSYKYAPGSRPCNVWSTCLKSVIWLILLVIGLFFVFAPYRTQTHVIQYVFNGSVTVNYGLNLIIGWIFLLIAICGLSHSFKWCRTHRPLTTRWKRKYRGWRSWSDDEDCSFLSINKRNRNKKRKNQNEYEDIDDNIDDNNYHNFAICALPRRFLKCKPTAIHFRSDIDRAFWQEVFKIDLMPALFIIVVVVLGTWLNLVWHSATPRWQLPPSFYFTSIFLGIFLIYFLFRALMIRRFRFIWNIILTLVLATAITHISVLFMNRGPKFIFVSYLANFFLLLFTMLALGTAVGIRQLYEF